MPAPSWFQKLRRRRNSSSGKKKQSPRSRVEGSPPAGVANEDSPSGKCQVAPPPPPPSEPSVSPNRASYYFPSSDRARRDEGGRRVPCVLAQRDDADAAAALDVRVDVVHRRAGQRRLGGLDAPPGTPELKLRPIVTRHDSASDDVSVSSATTSAATTPSTRARGFHVKPIAHRRRRRRRRDNSDGTARIDQKAAASPSQQHGGARRRRRWLYESLVVVKASSDPERELAESMAEMVAANGIRATEDLEEMLACYLALNAAEHHRAVVAAFRRVWVHLARHVAVAQPSSSQHPKP